MKYHWFSFSLLIAAVGAIAAPAPVADVSLSMQDLQQRIETLERMMNTRNKAQLYMQQQLELLQDEISEIRGVTELHNHRLEQLNNRQRELYQELEQRFSRIQNTQPKIVPTATLPDSSYSSSIDENQAYDRAVNLVLKDRRYDQAIPEFKKFIQTFPRSVYLPNAYYWLGQLLFNNGSFKEASTQFEKVISNYPESTKRSDSLFKLGTIAQKMNRITAAKQYFKQVISEYPESTSAKLAQPKLDILNK